MTSSSLPLGRPFRPVPACIPLAMAISWVHLVADALMHMAGARLPSDCAGDGRVADKVLDRPRSRDRRQALDQSWTLRLLAGEIDASVHSMKMSEIDPARRWRSRQSLLRADVRDTLVGAIATAIPAGGRLGTSSPRRSAQIKRIRPDLEIVVSRHCRDTARSTGARRSECDPTATAGLGMVRYGHVGTPVEYCRNKGLPLHRCHRH